MPHKLPSVVSYRLCSYPALMLINVAGHQFRRAMNVHRIAGAQLAVAIPAHAPQRMAFQEQAMQYHQQKSP